MTATKNNTCSFQIYYRTQTKFGARQCFYTCLSVILFTGWGVVFAFGSGDVHPLYTPPVEMAIEAGGMHPTGMHSCSLCLYKNIAQSKTCKSDTDVLRFGCPNTLPDYSD